MKLARRQFLQLAAGAAALPASVRAQAYPSRPVKIIVGQAAGSASDIVARLIALATAPRKRQREDKISHRFLGSGAYPQGPPGGGAGDGGVAFHLVGLNVDVLPCSPLPATTSACSCAGPQSFYARSR